ncbi:MAG: T9SS type A sorting domain-containing protein [Bacteroidetes bacterium]|nr:T9SS type A sorting domain-containing protein [Bacteroidota bacterium]
MVGYSVENIPIISTYPYIEDFESGSSGWSSAGVNNTWQLGAPAGAVINSAASGVKAWVTNLSGNYNNNEQSYVESPCFDLSSLSSTAVELQLWYDTESGWDGAALYYSTNSGATWQKAGAVGDPTNWYNDAAIVGLGWMGSEEGWAGATGGWISAKHDLPALAGQPDVVFRIVFGSDGSINSYDGFGFDDFSISGTFTGIKDNDLSTNVRIYPNPTKANFNISIQGKNKLGEVTLEITNLIGQTMLKEKIEVSAKKYSKEINTDKFAKGLYFVRLSDKDNSIIRKLIVQ